MALGLQPASQAPLRRANHMIGTGRPETGPPTVRSGWWLATIVAAGVGLPWLIAALSGNLAIPHNDAWSYSRIAADFARSGELRLLRWGRMSLIGQIVMLGPLGRWLAAQQTAVALLGGVAICCVYDLVRPSLTERSALFAAATFAVWPGFALLSTSFMTDVPALTASLLSISLGRRALTRGSARLLTLSLVTGFWALTIREQTAVAPVAVLYCAFRSCGETRIPRRAVVWRGALLLAAAAVFMAWRMHLQAGYEGSVTPTLAELGHPTGLVVASAFFTLAALLAPAILLGADVAHWRRSSLIVTVLVALGGLVMLHASDPLLIGNYLSFAGAYPAPGQGAVLPSWLCSSLEVVAIGSGGLLAGAIAERGRRCDSLLGAFTLLTFVATLATVISGQHLFDRYLMSFTPGLLAIALMPMRRAKPGTAMRTRHFRVGLASGACILIALTSILLTLNAYSRDHDTWSVAESLQSAGFGATQVDAGYEFDGWVSPTGISAGPIPVYGPGYGRLESTFPCVVVQAASLLTLPEPVVTTLMEFPHRQDQRASWTPIAVVRYRAFLLFGGWQRLYVYATHATGCSSKSSSIARAAAELRSASL